MHSGPWLILYWFVLVVLVYILVAPLWIPQEPIKRSDRNLMLIVVAMAGANVLRGHHHHLLSGIVALAGTLFGLYVLYEVIASRVNRNAR